MDIVRRRSAACQSTILRRGRENLKEKLFNSFLCAST